MDIGIFATVIGSGYAVLGFGGTVTFLILQSRFVLKPDCKTERGDCHYLKR